MNDRTAIDTIRGYFYQFDFSILQIFQLEGMMDTVCVEGIEDIDIKTADDTTAVQCKYYAKTEYNHSVIAEAIRWMLAHFTDTLRNGTLPVRYKLRGYYKNGQEKLVLPLSPDSLKLCFLTYKRRDIRHEQHIELGVTDQNLADFLGRFDLDILAESFEEQNTSLLKIIKSHYKCSEFTAGYFFYNNALRIIRELATQPDPADRTISKQDFLHQIDTSRVLFNEWFIAINGEGKFYQQLRKEYFTQLNVEAYDRFFLLEIQAENYERGVVKEVILLISSKWSKRTQRDRPRFCPYILLHGIENQELRELRGELYNEGHTFCDGFDYEDAAFNVKSLAKVPTVENNLKFKFVNRIDELTSILRHQKTTREIYQFYITEPFFMLNDPAVRHIKIQIMKIKAILEII